MSYILCFEVGAKPSVSIAAKSEASRKVNSVTMGLRAKPVASRQASDWGYGPNNGPSRWPSLGDNSCGGSRQSPINIVPECTRRLLQVT